MFGNPLDMLCLYMRLGFIELSNEEKILMMKIMIKFTYQIFHYLEHHEIPQTHIYIYIYI